MNTQNNKSESSDGTYLSKKVLVNGQFVTLYSVNGQTWISSPEDIPDLMARLENARIVLNNPEKQGEAAGEKAKSGEERKDTAEAAPKPPQNKYRMKGPKPRPILRQGGLVIKGTPVEPISASSTIVEVADKRVEGGEIQSKKDKAKSSKKQMAAKGVTSGSKGPQVKTSGVAMSAAKKGAAPAPKVKQPIKGSVSPIVAKPSGKGAIKKVPASAKTEMEARKSSAKSVAKAVKKSPSKAAPTKKQVSKRAVPVKKQGSSAKRGKSSR